MILVDSREPSKCIENGVKKFGTANIKVDTLITSDTIVNGMCFERKTWEDLYSSVTDGRLKNQCEKMKTYPLRFVIIEGDYDKFRNSDLRFRKCDKNWVRGVKYSIMIKYGAFVVFEDNNKDYWKSIDKAIYKQGQCKEIESSQIYTPKLSAKNKRTDLSMLCCIHGVSEKIGLSILEHFTLYDLYHVTLEDLQTIDKVGPVLSRKIKSEFSCPNSVVITDCVSKEVVSNGE